jgi:hypothetical protein
MRRIDPMVTRQLPGSLIDRSFRERIVLVGVVLAGGSADAVERTR